MNRGEMNMSPREIITSSEEMNMNRSETITSIGEVNTNRREGDRRPVARIQKARRFGRAAVVQ